MSSYRVHRWTGSDHNDQNGRKLRKAFQRPSGPFTVAGMAGAAIELRAVTKRFATPNGGIFTAPHNLTMQGVPGAFCFSVWATGCGQSTTLGLVSRLERRSAGGGSRLGRPV